ncbi:NADH:flavin oxidoreductase [Clostridia bacterium OttesenSCG-928-F22]|nr:NADH:flavin oxidoreductase [Clostridia bacterium OttesenSCG-928-F22]
MKSMFDEVTIGKIAVKNRFVRSATFEYGGDENGCFRQNIYDIIKALAKGEVGLIITGMMAVDENAGITPNMIKTFNDAFPAGMRRLAELVHQHGSKVVVQIAHCGAKVKETDAGLPPVAPSKLANTEYREMSLADIEALTHSFAAAAIHCKEAGADGVQLHAAHGYLLSQFLSPIFNHRTDAYGGSIENRARIVFEIYRAVRDAVGADYPVWLKINSSDIEKDGLSFEESLWVCEQLSEMGVDVIEVSGGISVSKNSAPARMVKNREQEGYFSKEALAISKKVAADVISVGGYRTLASLDEKLNEGEIKAISLCRPFISEPDLVSRWKTGNAEKARCISCNKCFAPGPLDCKVFST